MYGGLFDYERQNLWPRIKIYVSSIGYCTQAADKCKEMTILADDGERHKRALSRRSGIGETMAAIFTLAAATLIFWLTHQRNARDERQLQVQVAQAVHDDKFATLLRGTIERPVGGVPVRKLRCFGGGCSSIKDEKVSGRYVSYDKRGCDDVSCGSEIASPRTMSGSVDES